MQSDVELLRRYAEYRSESAFTELVRRHIDLVYSAALRETHGNIPQAEDITQAVFAELARKSSSLVRHPALAGWLYTCVRQMTANARRAEDRRQRREQEAQTMNELLSLDSSNPIWRQVQPVLDDAMHELSETDRAAVVLRFFEERSLKEVGLALGLNENAARMRVDRALEKLRDLLAKRGVTSTASGIAAAIAAGAVVSAPTALTASVVTGALAVSASTTSTTLTALKLMTMTKLKLGLITAVVAAGVATPLVIQHQTQIKLREENQSLRQQTEQLAAENERLTNLVGQAESSQSPAKDQFSELLKLRGEVGLLRKRTNELEKLRTENRRLQAALADAGRNSQQPENDPAVEQAKQVGIAKLNYAKYWMLAFILYAEKNQGQFPASLEQALPFLPDEAKTEHNLRPDEVPPTNPKYGLTPDRYEIVYQGTIKNLANPSSTIVLREKEAWPRFNGTGWSRTYGFADGHSEIHFSQDGNFDAWEKQHIALPAPPNP